MANKYYQTKVDVGKIIELYQSGMTQIEVAEELNTTPKIVWKRLKQSHIKCRRDAPRNQKGNKNNNWKGKDASYTAFHARMYVLKGKPKFCVVCGTSDKDKTYDWANLTKKYDDPNDYKRMCRSCHWKHDKKYFNFNKKRRCIQ